MSFTSVPAGGQSRAFAGMPADNGHGDVISGFSEEATNQIAFGTGVQTGTAPKGCKNLSGSGNTLKGVAEFSYMHAPGTFGDLGTTGVLPNGDVRIKRKGRVWLQLDAAQADGATALSITPFVDRGYCRYAAGSGNNTQIGAWSNVSDASKNLDCTRQVVFTSGVVTAPDGSLIAEAEVDFTNRNS